MVSLFQILVLSIVQGITEWLPISSSGHLALLENFFGFKSVSFNVFLHVAGIFAIILFFHKDIRSLFNLKNKENLRYLFLIFIALIPAGIIGILFKKEIEKLFSNMLWLGIFFIASGIMIYSTKFFKEEKEKISVFDSLFIGVFQAVGILPGISRSGATISGGIFRGLKRENMIKFSFILAIPVVLGASFFEAKELALSEINYSFLLISFIATFFVSLLSIKFLLRIIKGEKFYLFGVYNFLLGVLVVLWKVFF